mmetsp:Transcript_30431/g.72984  ORF Transcript_30431/g.72984 Transcript_30431/m.72984 type:complete len:155 (-) Transcript_30431:211-675(-)
MKVRSDRHHRELEACAIYERPVGYYPSCTVSLKLSADSLGSFWEVNAASFWHWWTWTYQYDGDDNNLDDVVNHGTKTYSMCYARKNRRDSWGTRVRIKWCKFDMDGNNPKSYNLDTAWKKDTARKDTNEEECVGYYRTRCVSDLILLPDPDLYT